MVNLTGGAAVITGGASGIGLGLARAALRRGMPVVLSDVNEDQLHAVAAALRNEGGDVTVAACDVRSADEVAELRDAALSAHGAVALVCNNAGVGFTKPMIDTRPADWDLVLDINVRGVVNGVDAFLPVLLEQGSGHISATSSLSGLVADPGLSLYNASKFAVAGIMEALGLELLEQDNDVSASVLCPGPVATQLATSSAATTGSSVDTDVADYLARGLAPDDVGEMAMTQIEEGRFWLITHPELTHDLINGRVAALQSGGLLHQPDTAWTEQ
jgi:NADP-dependent 3-hydroxy acid dehydrogenase YdfG